jgi:hypothetical protein
MRMEIMPPPGDFGLKVGNTVQNRHKSLEQGCAGSVSLSQLVPSTIPQALRQCCDDVLASKRQWTFLAARL